MTSPDYGELVRRLYRRDEADAADAIEQQAREIAALRQRSDIRAWARMEIRALAAESLVDDLRAEREQQAREIADLMRERDWYCLESRRLRAELTRHGIPLPEEPDTRGTGRAGEVGCG